MLQTFIGKIKAIALSKTARNTYFVFSGNMSSAVLAFFFTVILVRKLSFADFGYFSSLWSLLLLVTDLTDMGIGTSLSNFLPRLENQKAKLLIFLKTAFIYQCALAIIVALVIFLCSSFVSSLLFHSQKFSNLVQITAISIFFAIIGNFFLYALSGRQKFISVGFLSAIGSAARLALLFVLIFFFSVNLSSSIYIQLINLIAIFLCGIILLRPDFLKAQISIDDLKTIISYATFVGLARGMTAIASRLDVLMIVAFRGPTEAGIYATASRVTSLFPLLSGSFSTVIAPRFATLQDGNALRNFLIKVLLGTLVIIGGVILLAIFAYPFMTILFGEKGSTASGVFVYLLIGMIFFVASIAPVSLLLYHIKMPKILTFNSILQLGIVVIANLILIPKYGYYGASYSLILSYGITLTTTTILTYLFYKKM